MKFLHSRKVIIILLLTSVIQYSYSQSEENKWIIGIGMNATDFYPTNEPTELTGNTKVFGINFVMLMSIGINLDSQKFMRLVI